MSTTIFQSERCLRCSGSGHYSRNAQGSTRCYDCHGDKVRLTKIGLKARARMLELQNRPASTVKAGDNLHYTPFLGRGKWYWVRSVEQKDEGDLARIEIGIKGMTILLTPESIVRTVRDEADRQQTIDAALAYQAEMIARQAKRAATKEKAA